jgi:hypothetical protein
MPQYALAVNVSPATLAYVPRTTRRLQLVPAKKIRVLLVCDAPTDCAKYFAALSSNTVEMICVSEAAEIRAALQNDYALVIVNVPANQLVETLAALRSADDGTAWPILVEASDSLNETQFAGVLPRYRAMACGAGELIALARQRLVPRAIEAHKSKML